MTPNYLSPAPDPTTGNERAYRGVQITGATIINNITLGKKRYKIAAGAQNDTVEYGLIGHTINNRATPSKSLEFEKCWSESLNLQQEVRLKQKQIWPVSGHFLVG